MKRIRIIPRAPISEFADVVYAYRHQLYRLWLISPWIGCYKDESIDPLQLLIDALRSQPKCMINVITRRPQPKATWHSDAVRLLNENVNPTLFYCDSLHTKLYIVETTAMTAVMLGSPNLTAGGNTANLELALELRTASGARMDEVVSTVSDLVGYAHELLKDDSVTIAD